MIEVEVKIPVSDLNEIIEKLETSGFRFAKEVQEIDTYYTGTFHDMRAHDEALRIRSYTVKGHPEENRFFITFKGPKLDTISMSRQEYETSIEDPEIMHRILNALEYHEAGKVSKTRVYYQCDCITICADTVENLGTFIEAEILAENENERESALEQIRLALNFIGLRFEDTVTTSYLSMLQRKQQ